MRMNKSFVMTTIQRATKLPFIGRISLFPVFFFPIFISVETVFGDKINSWTWENINRWK